MKRGDTDCRPFKKRWEDQATLKVNFTVKTIFFDATIGSNSNTICIMHLKNIFPTDSRQPISLYKVSIRFIESFTGQCRDFKTDNVTCRGVDGYVGRLSVDMLVDISAEYHRLSIEYRSCVGRVSVDMWPIVGPWWPSVDSQSIVGRYFTDGSLTYHWDFTDTRPTPRWTIGLDAKCFTASVGASSETRGTSAENLSSFA